MRVSFFGFVAVTVWLNFGGEVACRCEGHCPRIKKARGILLFSSSSIPCLGF